MNNDVLITDERIHLAMVNCHTARGHYRDDEQYISLTQAEGLATYYCGLYEQERKRLTAQIEQLHQAVGKQAIDATRDGWRTIAALRAEIDALQAQLAEARAGTYQPITGNITFARNGNLFVMDATSLDGLPFPDDVRLCQLQPAQEGDNA